MYASSRASTSTFGGLNSAVAGNGVASAQEQASADLVLLQQNLAKSKRVTTRMTALLTSFDDRLARLDKSVVPIHRSTRDLSKVQRNVEAALLAIDSVLGTNDLVDREQEIIDRLPDRDGLGVYQASLTRLKAALDSMEKVAASAGAGGGSGNNNGGAAALAGMKGKEKETTLGRVRDLIEMGCERIGGLFLETVEMVSPKTGWPDITAWDQGTPFPALIPQDTDDFLKSQLSFIQTILSKDSPLERDLQKGYGDIRGVYMAATLNQVGREAVDGVEVQTRAGSLAAARMPAFGRRVFGRFLDAMFAIAKVRAYILYTTQSWNYNDGDVLSLGGRLTSSDSFKTVGTFSSRRDFRETYGKSNTQIHGSINLNNFHSNRNSNKCSYQENFDYQCNKCWNCIYMLYRNDITESN